MMQTYKVSDFSKGVEYKIPDGQRKYRVNNGLLQSYDEKLEGWRDWEDLSYNESKTVEFLECEFIPDMDKRYYYPTFDNKNGYESKIWAGDPIDKNIQESIGVFRTSEQARRMARELDWIAK